MKEKEGKRRAVLYKRLSKEDMDKVSAGDESASIQNQQLLLTDFAIREGFQIVDIYSDDDYSGLFDDRPEFERLLRDARAGRFDVVIAKSQSRFTRNMEHLEKYLHNEFLDWGIRFIGVVDHIDTSVKGNKKARQINGLINEWYCEDLSENIRATFQAKMRQGQFIGSSTPYGYKKDPEDRHHLVVDEYAADIVRRIYAMYLSGMGKGGIAAALSAEEVLIPSAYKTQVLHQNYHNANALPTTRLWSYQTVHQILQNEVYIGNTVQYKSSAPSYKTRRKRALPPDEWIRVENTHEAVIDKETFQTVQRLGRLKTRRVESAKTVGAFSGFLYCYDCKHAMLRSYNKKGEFDSFVCKTYKRHGNRFCSSHRIKKEELSGAVLASLRKQAGMILGPSDIQELDDKKEENSREDERRRLEALRTRREEIGDIRAQAYLDYASKFISAQEYEACRRKLDAREREIDGQMKLLGSGASETERTKDKRGRWEERFRDGMDVDQVTREMVVGLIDRIEIHADRQMDIYYRFRNPYIDGPEDT